MAVTRRLRYEVLRRDNHTCRYCGEAAPGTNLTVDHVVPTALGGSDEPTNLVTSCQPCNAGKAATVPDAPIVEDVKQDALRWGRALTMAADIRSANRTARDEYAQAFKAKWESWHCKGAKGEPVPLPRPEGYIVSVWRFYELGLPIEELCDCVEIAMSKERLVLSEVFKYMCGCAWRQLDAIQQAATEIVTAEENDGANSVGQA